jgi:hypothetical protein
MKEKLSAANYQYVKFLGDKEHLVKDNTTGSYEIFFSNKNHASWGLKWKNTHLEFFRSLGTHPVDRLDNLLQNRHSHCGDD